MKKIYGDQAVIERVKQAKPGDKTMYINWEAINELPEEYEVIITEIKFDSKKLDGDFSNVGADNNPSWMPATQLMYRVAEACGISGGENSIAEPLMEDVDINPMLMKSMEDAPTYRKMKVGAKVVKYATRLQEDGTPLRSSPCTSEFNVWERCQELWSKEEMYTEGYSKPSKYPNKYDTQYKRRNHFQSELKFAHAKAETKAYLKSIRELAGLQTGYRTEDLNAGRLVFARVRRSREVLRMETAARLQAISKGIGTQEAEKLLFGTVVDEAQPIPPEADPEVVEQEPTETFTAPEPVKPPETTKREEMIAVLKNYLDTDLIVEEYKESAKNIFQWLVDNQGAEADAMYWPKAIGILTEIEKKIPEEGRITHGLY